MKRTYEQMNSITTEEVLSSHQVTNYVENRITMDDNMEDIETISGSVISYTPINYKLPYFSLNNIIEGISHSNIRKRIESLSDLKLKLLSSIYSFNNNEITNIIDLLKNRLHIELNEVVKQLIIECLTLFIESNSKYSLCIIDELLLQFKYKSNSIKATLLQSFEKIFNSKQTNKFIKKSVEDICIELLQTRNVLVRKRALSLLTRISTDTNIQEILSQICELDPDPRVRCIAFKGFLILHQRKITLDINLYRRAVYGMDDDNSDVKLYALELMWLLCNLHPFHIYTTKNSEKIRLVDDGFIRICNMVTDPCVSVRAKASRLLGGLQNVSTQYLLQAFSKELFGKGSKITLSRTKSNEISAAGDFDITQNADVDVLDSSAGAFVHGLEDEYYQVRMATIDSICELSSSSPEFARIAVEFLVDMFNDEIDAVRINSIHSLRKISSHIQLNEEQLQIAMSALEDVTERLRYAMHQLLMTVQLSNIQSVNISIQGLLNNLKKYPEDKEHIYQTLQGIGLNHSHFVEYLVEDLLNIDLNFAQMEANVNDVFYIAKLIAVLNASSKNNHILTLLPKHTSRHYRYLKDKYPLYFPSMLLFDNQISSISTINNNNQTIEPVIDISDYFNNTWMNILNNYKNNNNFDLLLPMINTFSKTLQHISRTHEYLSSFVDFYTIQHKILTLMLQAQSCKLKEETSKIIPELLHLSYSLENTLFGLHSNDIIELYIIRLFCHILDLINSLSNQEYNTNNIKSTKNIKLLEERVSFINEYCTQTGITSSEKLNKITNSISSCFSQSSNISLANNLLDLLQIFTINPIIVRNQLKTLRGNITLPKPNSENPIKFNPILPLKIQVHANIENMMNTTGIMILCIYPDHRETLFPILEKNIIPITTYTSEILCNVSLQSHQAWNEQNAVSLQLVRTFKTDIPEKDNEILKSKSNNLTYVKFGQPVLFHIFPEKGYQPKQKKK